MAWNPSESWNSREGSHWEKSEGQGQVAFGLTIFRTGYTVKVGDQVHGFKLTAIDHIRDFNIVAYSLEHQKTGAKYLHLDTEDMENVSYFILACIPCFDVTMTIGVYS